MPLDLQLQPSLNRSFQAPNAHTHPLWTDLVTLPELCLCRMSGVPNRKHLAPFEDAGHRTRKVYNASADGASAIWAPTV